MLHYTLLLLIGVALVFPIFATSTAQLIYIPIILALFGLCFFLLHTNRYRLASGIFLTGFWSIITPASYSLNGIRNASFSSYAIIIIFAAILFSARAVLLVMALSIVSGIVLVVGESQGILPFRTTPLFLPDRLFQNVALFGSAGVLLFAASRVLRNSFNRIRASEQTLLERNQALENEIAERKRIEATLRASEEKYRLLFENNRVVCAVYDREGTLVLINQAAAQLFDTTSEALRGRAIYDILTPADAAAAMEQQARVMATGIAEIAAGETTLPNGKSIYFYRQIVPLPQPQYSDTASQSSHVLVITSDLTEQKRIEQREGTVGSQRAR